MDPKKDAGLYSSGMMAAVPVIRGTRVSVLTLIEYLEDGRGLDAFLAAHPQVTAAQANQTIVGGLRALIQRRKVIPRGRDNMAGSNSPEVLSDESSDD